MADKRIFTIQIDGIEKSYTDTVKLLDVLNKIKDVHAKVKVDTDNASKSIDNGTKSSKEKAKALTEEEKAQKKLNETQEKANKEIQQNEIEQVKANIQLKERAKLLQNMAKLELAAKNSPAEFKAELALLNQEWDKIEVGTQAFEDLTAKVDALNQKLKESEFAKGSFGRNVGNYPEQINAVNQSFENLGNGVHKTTEDAKGFFSAFQAGVGIALIFDDQNSELSKTMNSLGKVMAIVGALQQANNTLIKSGTVSQIAYNLQNKTRAGLDSLVTKGIITQTTAQTALNIATKAFPLLAVISVIVAAIGLLSSYSKKTKEAANDTENLSSKTEALKKESEQTASSLASSIVIYKRLQRQWNDLANDLDKKKQFVIDNKNEFNSLGIEVNNVNDAESVLVTNTDAVINSLKLRAQAAAAQQIATEKYAEALKKQAEAEQRALNPTGSELARGKSVFNYEDRDGLKNVPVFQGTDLSIEAAKPIKEEGEKLLKEADAFFDKYIGLTNKSTQELTSVGIKAVTKLSNDVKNMTKSTGDGLTKINEDLINERIKAIEDAEQREITTLQNNLQKRLSTIKGNSEEEKELRKLLAENSEKDIAEIRQKYQKVYEDENTRKIEQQKSTWEKIRQINKENLDADIKELTDAQDKELLAITKNLEEGIITRDEYNEQISAISISALEKEISIRKSYGEDTTNLERQLSEKRIQQAEKEKGEQLKTLEDFVKKVEEYANNIMSAVGSVFSSFNSILEMELEDANEKYDAISQKYDEVVEKREESNSRLQDLEEEAKNAKGGRLLILQQQINEEMQANTQLASQEKQLAKEKEKQEKEIAKKEKQMKKVELAQNIVQGIANTALGVTQALKSTPPPFSYALAAIVGAMGAVQVGVMTRQLAKLEDGGLLKGKRHSNGGMRVEGTNIEVEGGEYVVNRESTAKNIGLIRYINSQRKELTPSDVHSFFSKSYKSFEPPFRRMFETGGQLPAIENTVSIDNESLVDAIQRIKIEPRVSVTDINDAQNDIVRVNDIVGL